jgi:hypothetical protein
MPCFRGENTKILSTRRGEKLQFYRIFPSDLSLRHMKTRHILCAASISKVCHIFIWRTKTCLAKTRQIINLSCFRVATVTQNTSSNQNIDIEISMLAIILITLHVLLYV